MDKINGVGINNFGVGMDNPTTHGNEISTRIYNMKSKDKIISEEADNRKTFKI